MQNSTIKYHTDAKEGILTIEMSQASIQMAIDREIAQKRAMISFFRSYGHPVQRGQRRCMWSSGENP